MPHKSLIREKIGQAVEILKQQQIDCWITFARESAVNGDPMLDFLVGSDITWQSAFIVTSAGKKVAIVGLYDQATVEDLDAYDTVISYTKSIRKHFAKVMQEINPSSIAINYSKGSEICDGLTYGMYLILKEMLDELGFGDRIQTAEKIISSLRGRKSDFELSRMQQAIDHTLEIYSMAGDFIAPGRSEKEIADFILAETERRGLVPAWAMETCPSVFTGPETASAHYSPTNRKVEKGHVLNMDFGVKVDGYCSDLQRTWYILEDGEETAPPDVQKGFDTIVESIDRARKALKPGVKGLEIDAVARDYIVSRDYEDFPFGLGHQVGRHVHDGTALLGPAWEKYARKPFEPIEEGMVFTIEPRIKVPGRGEVTIEEMVHVTANGAEFISAPQKQIFLVSG